MAQDRGPATSAVTIVMVAVATAFVLARFFTRAWLVRSLKQDDWWILAAWILAVAFSTSVCVGVHYGLGRHRIDIPSSSLPSLRRAEYAFLVLYNPCLMLIKTSIISFYLAVMSKDVDPLFKWANWFTLAIVNGAGVALTILNIFQCSPVSAGYKSPTPPNAKCRDIVTLYLSSAPVNIITDIAILVLPMPILTRLRLPKKQKIILVVTFSFGIFLAAVDVVRIAYLQDAALSRLQETGDSKLSLEDSNDFNWYSSLSFMWSAVEVNLGIICACVPSLKPLFLRFLPSFVRNVGETEFSPNSSQVSYTGTSSPPKRSASAPAIAVKGNVSMVNNPAAFRQSSLSEYRGDGKDDGMGFLDFLAGDYDGPTLQHKDTRTSSAVSNFDFVRMGKKRNMLLLSNRQSLWPIAVVTVVFFLWGFAYGLLNALNGQFSTIVHLTTQQALGLHAAYYGGYLAGALTLGQFILKRYGFKASLIVGLCVYGCGTVVFWPSAVLASYTAFVFSNLIVGFGLACLEISANPYVALCGPLEYAEVRLNFSQGIQAIGSVVSPLLATKVLFKSILDAPSLVNVQWTYLGLALFVWVLALVLFYIPLPEANDEQLEQLAEQRSAVYKTKVGPYHVIWVTLALGVVSQFCYVGGQEAISVNTNTLMLLLNPRSNIEPTYWHTVAHTVFAVGRFMTAFLNYVIKPRWTLLFEHIGLVIMCGLQMSLNGSGGITVLMLIYLFESGIFSIIFAISMRGMGAHTKTASAFMTAAISGGAPFVVLQWAAFKDSDFKTSYAVPLAVFAVGMIFPIYLNLVPAAGRQVDPMHEHRKQRKQHSAQQQASIATEAPVSKRFDFAGILARRKRHASEESRTDSEHVKEPGSQLDLKIRHGSRDSEIVSNRPVSATTVSSRGHVGRLASWPNQDENHPNNASPGTDNKSIEHILEKDFAMDHGSSQEYEKVDDYHAALKTIR